MQVWHLWAHNYAAFEFGQFLEVVVLFETSLGLDLDFAALELFFILLSGPTPLPFGLLNFLVDLFGLHEFDFVLNFGFFRLHHNFHALLFLVADVFINFTQNGYNSLALSHTFAIHLLVEQSLVPILDHVFGSGIFEQRNDPGPLGAMCSDFVEQHPVLLLGPVSLVDLVVEVVLPALSALLGTLEVLALGLEVEILGDLVPLALAMLPALIQTYK